MPFPITCAACQKTFSIADDVYERKVKGRVVTIKCKQCHAGIRVDGTKDTPVFSVADSADSRPAGLAPVAVAPAEVIAPGASSPVAVELAAPTPALPASAAEFAPAKAMTITASTQEPKPTAPAPLTGTAPKTAHVAPKAANAIPAMAPKAGIATAAAQAVSPAPVVAARAAPAATKTPSGAKTAPFALAPKAPAVALTPKVPAVAGAPKAAAGAATKAPSPGPVLASAHDIVAGSPGAAGAAASPSETLWAVEYPDGEDRELTLRQIEKELAAGAISESTLVWRDGMDEWLELGQVPELRAAPPKAKPTRPEPPPQRPRALTASGLGDLPAQRPRAPSAPALSELLATLPQPASPPPSAGPPAPSPPEIDFAGRELRAAPAAPVPSPKRPPSAPGDARPPTPPAFSAGPTPSAAFTRGTFPLAPAPPVFVPAAALMAAPFARSSPTPIGAVAPIANVEDWPRKSRMPLIVGGIALLAVGGLIFFLTRPAADDRPAPASISALPPALPSTPRPVEPGAATIADAPSPAEPGPGSRAALQPPGSAPTPTAAPNAGFAELFASGARGADEKHGVTGPTQRFDASAAKTALASAANQTPACREKGGPTGKATVVVTFEPSGKVSSATVSDPPFAGTSSGACIAAAMKRATVPPFSGLPGTVTKLVSIQ